MSPYAEWLDYLAWFFVALSLLCALIILLDEFRKPQKMFIMNLVWPITALYGNGIALWAYFNVGRQMSKEHEKRNQKQESGGPPSRAQVALAVSHCGAGCALGDITAESLAAAAALTFIAGVFPTRVVLDFLLAWSFGVIFQYFTIVPMRGLSPGAGLWAAVRADTFSIVAFQIGMLAWMALTYYVLFPAPHLNPAEALFWFMMQIAMVIGFFTSYPANVLLLNWGWKERMG